MMNQAAFSDVYLNLAHLGELRAAAAQQSPEALDGVARQFEGIFVKMMLKSMREASFGDPLFDTEATGLYRDLYDHQLSLELTKGRGLGIAEMLVQQLKEFVPGTSAELSTNEPASAADMQRLERNPALPAVAPVKPTATHGPEFVSKKSFLDTLLPLAKRAAKALGAEPVIMLAQAALETGWGRSIIRGLNGQSSHNLFGIKATKDWQGESVPVGTLEYEDGVATRRQALFRAYESFEQSFSDYVALLRGSPRYAGALAEVADPEAFMRALQQAGYATDPQYAEKVLRIWREDMGGASR